MSRAPLPRPVGGRRTWFGVLVAVTTVMLLSLAPGAAADDIYEIDGRLMEAGFSGAYTEAFDAADRRGVRVVVDYASSSSSAEEYQQEGEALAELVWDHLDGKLLALDVAPTYDVEWSLSGLPPAVSFDRATLHERFGPRPAGLDQTDLETVQDAGEEAGLVVGLAITGWVLSLVAAVAITFTVTRARYRPARTWAGTEAWPTSWPASTAAWTGPPPIPAQHASTTTGRPAARPPEPERPARDVAHRPADPEGNPWRPLT